MASSVGVYSKKPGRDLGCDPPTVIDRRHRERRDQPPVRPRRTTATHRMDGRSDDGHRRVVTPVGLAVLDLDVDQHPVAARIEDLVEARERIERGLIGRERIVEHDEAGAAATVSSEANVELDAVGAHPVGRGECRRRVLGFGSRRSSMTDDVHGRQYRPRRCVNGHTSHEEPLATPAACAYLFARREVSRPFSPTPHRRRNQRRPSPLRGESERVDSCVQPGSRSRRLRLARRRPVP